MKRIELLLWPVSDRATVGPYLSFKSTDLTDETDRATAVAGL
ncbi:MAG: hypothetical protein WHX52_15775 [Anaerolineae bacterium]